MKRLYASLFALLLVAACKSKKEDPAAAQKSGQSKTIVDVIIAAPQTITSIIEANGTVVANEYVELHPEVSGRLTYLHVPEGSYIQQGTVIARINDADLQAQSNKTRVLLDLAQKNEERLAKLLKVNGINQSDYDAALSAENGYKADLVYTQSLIDKTVIKAPFSGAVGLRQVSAGAYLTPANIIATIQQTDKIKIDFTLPEEYSGLIRKGNTVKVIAGAAGQTSGNAVITATEPQVNQTTRNLKVRAVLQGGHWNPGAFVKVYLTAGADTKAIMVPTGSIIADDKDKQLIVVKNGRADFVNVQTGTRQADLVEVVKGINPGDSVVVTGVLFARPKAPVKVRSVKTLEQVKN
ncbi:MAG: efflux RND transporter periplasmic adaptor subunit [Sediminibacterium sp.]